MRRWCCCLPLIMYIVQSIIVLCRIARLVLSKFKWNGDFWWLFRFGMFFLFAFIELITFFSSSLCVPLRRCVFVCWITTNKLSVETVAVKVETGMMNVDCLNEMIELVWILYKSPLARGLSGIDSLCFRVDPILIRFCWIKCYLPRVYLYISV